MPERVHDVVYRLCNHANREYWILRIHNGPFFFYFTFHGMQRCCLCLVRLGEPCLPVLRTPRHTLTLFADRQYYKHLKTTHSKTMANCTTNVRKIGTPKWNTTSLFANLKPLMCHFTRVGLMYLISLNVFSKRNWLKKTVMYSFQRDGVWEWNLYNIIGWSTFLNVTPSLIDTDI